jgi:hypothetical protein
MLRGDGKLRLPGMEQAEREAVLPGCGGGERQVANALARHHAVLMLSEDFLHALHPHREALGGLAEHHSCRLGRVSGPLGSLADLVHVQLTIRLRARLRGCLGFTVDALAGSGDQPGQLASGRTFGPSGEWWVLQNVIQRIEQRQIAILVEGLFERGVRGPVPFSQLEFDAL